jgi:chromosome partitioning protein
LKRILVANSKGGSGKTLTTVNIAAGLAHKGHRVCVVDADQQLSATKWAKRRPAYCPRVDCVQWPKDMIEMPKLPKKTEFAIIDSAGGLEVAQEKPLFEGVDFLIVPVMASLFDELATRTFLRSLAEIKRIKKDKITILPVGARIDLRRKDTDLLAEFMEKNKFPLHTNITERAVYPSLARDGLSVFDHSQAQYVALQAQWATILETLVGT